MVRDGSLHALLPSISVAEAFAGASVLLTGGTGFVGSLVLEQLLRVAPDLARVLIVVRPKHGDCPAERRRRLLDGGLFNRLWPQPQLLDKVEVLEGDLLQPGCGISEGDRLRLRDVTIVLHAAASVTFTEHIFASLASNYRATAELADVAAQLPLRAFVHVSTAYVNGFLPQGSRVEERFYAARCEGRSIVHADFVRRLEGMSAAEAEAFVARLAFPNTYCLSKWLAEQLLAERHSATGLPLAVVRPAIIGAVAGTPYPGYVGNRTGATGAALAIAHGMWLFSQHTARSVIDLVPGDAVSSAILLAAATTVQEPLIVHVGTSASDAPLCTGRFYQEVRAYFSAHPPRYSLRLRGGLPRRVLVVRSPAAAAACEAFGQLKFGLISAALWLTGRRALAARIMDAWRAVKVFNQKRLEFDLRFETDALAALTRRLPQAERPAVRPLWRPCNPGDWTRYMQTYMAGAAALCLRQPPGSSAGKAGCATDSGGGFEFVPLRSAADAAAAATAAAKLGSGAQNFRCIVPF